MNGVNDLNSGVVVLGAAGAGHCDTCTIVFGNAGTHDGLHLVYLYLYLYASLLFLKPSDCE